MITKWIARHGARQRGKRPQRQGASGSGTKPEATDTPRGPRAHNIEEDRSQRQPQRPGQGQPHQGQGSRSEQQGSGPSDQGADAAKKKPWWKFWGGSKGTATDDGFEVPDDVRSAILLVQLSTLNDTDATDSGSRPISSRVLRKAMLKPAARGLASMSW